MQKVSKQSLAMLALSILLAISIALTFTFAAFSSSRTAEGTITFDGGIGLIYTGITDNDSITFTIVFGAEGQPELKSGSTNLADIDLALANTSKSATTLTTSIEYLDDAATAEGKVLTAMQALIEKVEPKTGSWNAGDTVVEGINTLMTITNIEELSAEQFNTLNTAGELKVKLTFTATAA